MSQYRVSEAPKNKLERMIYTALRTEPNTIAGRPNAGNLALRHIHKGRVLPRSVMESYCLHALKCFMPELRFKVEAAEPVHDDGFQGVIVTYLGGI